MITPGVFQDRIGAALDRRRFYRLNKAVQTEIRIQGQETPVRAETADISLGGCYVEMAITLEVGTALRLVLWLGHKKVEINAKVVMRHPQFGNGIEFDKMSDDSRAKLRAFLNSIEGRREVVSAWIAQPGSVV
jgi:c-di-GMP-binding flagellar brake protein YcgR